MGLSFDQLHESRERELFEASPLVFVVNSTLPVS
jgi:hypothetical protein